MIPSVLVLMLMLMSCQSADDGLAVSRMHAYGSGVAGLSLSLRSVDASSVADDVTVSVQTRSGDAAWADAEVTRAGASDHLEVALVADNSGSEDGYLAPMSDAVGAFGHAVLDRDGGDGTDKLGLVRVSTQSSVALDLTDDSSAWDAAVDDLYIANGWTALWDGVRLGNETLQDGAEVSTAGGLEVCLGQARRSVVVFTDGQDNNSADEHDTVYDGDGVDTDLSDLLTLQVLGVGTPVFAVGIGTDVDTDQLQTLADGSGGDYRAVDAYDELSDALVDTVAELYDEVPVCFEAAECTDDEARIVVTEGESSWEAVVALPGLCGCTRTRGYWQTHEDLWPLDSLVLGDRSYDADAGDTILETSSHGDKSLQLASQLIAAKLNVAAGASDADIADVIDAADAWLVGHDDGDGVPCDVFAWDGGEEIKDALDAWNNGDTGPGHCG